MSLLEESFNFEQPERGDLLTGMVLAIDDQGMIVDVGMNRDAVVPRSDLERMEGVTYAVGQEVALIIVHPEDQDGNLVASVSQARQSEDWIKVKTLMASGEVWEGVVVDANRGGVIVPFGSLRGFIPASHIADLPRGMSEDDRKNYMMNLVGQKITVKVIEVDRKRRRLILSQRDAQHRRRNQHKETLLEELQEGDVCRGVVSSLRDFGAFVDVGGADGLIHISELAWHRVGHPREVLSVGDEIDVFILRLDHDNKRIALSLKRMQPNPWALIDDLYHVGQLVEGVVSHVAQFGAFVSLDPGIEALLHINQIADQAPEDPAELLHEGDRLLMRIISIDSRRQRLGLSLKDVTEADRQRWTAEHGTILTVALPGAKKARTSADSSEADGTAIVDESVEEGTMGISLNDPMTDLDDVGLKYI
jgi:small subunit ribosomal protein S1